MNERKKNSKPEKVDYYKLDLDNNQLVASTKEFRKKEKLCKLIFLIF